jgi:hypothetical protein
MSYNKISYARNRLKQARAAIGRIQLDDEVYGSLLIAIVVELYAALGEAIAILEAPVGMDARIADQGEAR